MKVGAFTVAKGDLPLEAALDWFVEAGMEAVEIGTGNFPGNSHCDPVKLNADAKARAAFKKAITSRGLELAALSCHGNPLHPNKRIAKSHHEVWRETVKLAKSLGVETVVNFSGLPGGSSSDKVPNWVVAPWPEDQLQALEYQWNEVAIPYWKEEAAVCARNGGYVCFEMHPNFLVYNPETLIKLREGVGKNGNRRCANFDPSHLFWQGIEPSAAIRWLQSKGDVIKHFHAKDSLVYQWNARVNGVLDTKHYGDEPNRAWIFRSVGYGHGEDVWRDMISTLRMMGYDGVLSIEHEDSLMTADEGFRKGAALLKQVVISEAAGPMTWA